MSKNLDEIPKGVMPNWGAKERWGRFKSAIFHQCLAIYEKQIDGDILVTVEG